MADKEKIELLLFKIKILEYALNHCEIWDRESKKWIDDDATFLIFPKPIYDVQFKENYEFPSGYQIGKDEYVSVHIAKEGLILNHNGKDDLIINLSDIRKFTDFEEVLKDL